MSGCIVLPGLFGVFVQGLLFLCCVAVLVGKKLHEGASRTWWDFGLDSSKQFLGAGWIHVLNLFFATLLERMTEDGDQCEWYWLNIMLDTTLGVAVEYVLLVAFGRAATSLCPESAEDFKSGEYRNADGGFDKVKYAKQLVVWLAIVSGMKLSMVLLMIVFGTPLQATAGFILSPFMTSPELKLLAVMIVTPICMNALQFWITDNFIKKQDSKDKSRRFEDSADSEMRDVNASRIGHTTKL
jgi:hypothetical protein